jgi:hypothetical protein
MGAAARPTRERRSICPARWKRFDPTVGDIAGSRHIAVAVARLPEVVSPVTGAFFGPTGADLAVGAWVSEL